MPLIFVLFVENSCFFAAAHLYRPYDYRAFVVVNDASGYVSFCSTWFGLSFVHPHPEFRTRIKPPASKRGVFFDRDSESILEIILNELGFLCAKHPSTR